MGIFRSQRPGRTHCGTRWSIPATTRCAGRRTWDFGALHRKLREHGLLAKFEAARESLMGTLTTPEAGRVGSLLRVPLAEFACWHTGVSRPSAGRCSGAGLLGSLETGRHPFAFILCQNDMSRKQNHIPGQLQRVTFRRFSAFKS